MQIISAFGIAFTMLWDVFWSLEFGLILSAVVQSVVSHKTIVRMLGNNSLQTLTLASLFGAASSSCSYASVALSRSIFRKGASFTASMIFQMASTNLVIELGVILLIILGWKFLLAEVIGGIMLLIILALIFKFSLPRSLVNSARKQADLGLTGRMEGHAGMDMSLEGKSFWNKLFSIKGINAISHYFFMDISSIWTDLLLGFALAGLITEFVPVDFWHHLFFVNDQSLAFILGPLIAPLVAIISFVCSVGNIPLAAVLWRDGMSFGGAIAFIFSDLLILPILNIYRRYYGLKMMWYLLITFYISIVLSGYAIEIIFSLLRITPNSRSIDLFVRAISFNYTMIFNVIALMVLVFLFYRFITTGGVEMLRMMNQNPGHHHEHHH